MCRRAHLHTHPHTNAHTCMHTHEYTRVHTELAAPSLLPGGCWCVIVQMFCAAARHVLLLTSGHCVCSECHTPHRVLDSGRVGGMMAKLFWHKKKWQKMIWSLCFIWWEEMSFISVSNCKRRIFYSSYHFQAYSFIRFPRGGWWGRRGGGGAGGGVGGADAVAWGWLGFLSKSSCSHQNLLGWEITSLHRVKHILLTVSLPEIKRGLYFGTFVPLWIFKKLYLVMKTKDHHKLIA